MIAVKGVGWGLKTMGRQYPELVTDWLAEQVVPSELRFRTLMLRKALTYLSDEQRARATGVSPRETGIPSVSHSTSPSAEECVFFAQISPATLSNPFANFLSVA
jgi:hypothetical protein